MGQELGARVQSAGHRRGRSNYLTGEVGPGPGRAAHRHHLNTKNTWCAAFDRETRDLPAKPESLASAFANVSSRCTNQLLNQTVGVLCSCADSSSNSLHFFFCINALLFKLLTMRTRAFCASLPFPRTTSPSCLAATSG